MSGTIPNYFSSGAGAPSAGPSVPTGELALYWDTTNKALYEWDGAAWNYAMPTATTSKLGVVKVDGSTVTISGGVITAAAGGTTFSWTWVLKSAAYTLTTSDTGILVDTSGAARTMTLPTAVGATVIYGIKKKTSDSNAVTVATTSAQTIDGASTYTLRAQQDTVYLASDGSNWYTINPHLANLLVTTKGDLVTSDGTSAKRFGAGADGTVLTADSAQTLGIKYAVPAMVQISDQTVSGSVAASIAFSSLGSYNHLMLVLQARGDTAANNVRIKMQMNSDTTTAHYEWEYIESYSGNTANGADNGSTTSCDIGAITANTSPASCPGQSTIMIPNYAGTTWKKSLTADYGYMSAGGAAGMLKGQAVSWWLSTAAITSLLVFPAAGNFAIGSRFTLYGLT